MKRGVTVSFLSSTIKTFLPDMFMTQSSTLAPLGLSEINLDYVAIVTQILLALRVLRTPGSGGYLPWPENKVMILQLM